MHFLAGFYYLIYRDEATTFTMLCTLIANLNLSYLFKQDVPMLRLLFYQMNRLIAVYLPRLHSHLFEEGVNSTFFCSPWFLTAFTAVMQCSKERGIPLLLHIIVDGFLTVRAPANDVRAASSRYSAPRCSFWHTLRRSW